MEPTETVKVRTAARVLGYEPNEVIELDAAAADPLLLGSYVVLADDSEAVTSPVTPDASPATPDVPPATPDAPPATPDTPSVETKSTRKAKDAPQA